MTQLILCNRRQYLQEKDFVGKSNKDKWQEYYKLCLENQNLIGELALLSVDHKDLQQGYDELKTKNSLFIDQIGKYALMEEELNKKIAELSEENIKLRTELDDLKNKYDVLYENSEKIKSDVDELKKENKILIENNKMLNGDNIILKNKFNKFEALSKLYDCDALANNALKTEYKKYFKLKKYDNNVPNLGDFIENPPDEHCDKDEYDFWDYFCKKYPDSNNKKFREFYKNLNSQRLKCGAHHNVSRINRYDFDNLIQIVFPDIYFSDKKLCKDYENWLFLFDA